MSNISSGNLTSGFIDLATFDEIERFMYGQKDATAYFVRDVRKSTWFTQVPVVLSRSSGTPAFGQEWSVAISRAGDYLLQTWLRLTVNAVDGGYTGYDNGATTVNPTKTVRWTKNFMHNLIRECSITFNDLVAARFDSYHLDFWAAFTTPASKQNGYQNMIGNLDSMTSGTVIRGPPDSNYTDFTAKSIPAHTLNLPLPFFFTRDSGVALPTAALPYNEMSINFAFRDWSDLLIGDASPDGKVSVGTQDGQIKAEPTLSNVQVWANYAIVSNQERKRMGCAPRDILIEMAQTVPRQSFTPGTNAQQSFDIRLSHAIKVLFFAVRNTTKKSEWSNYTCTVADVHAPTNATIDTLRDVSYDSADHADPILQTSLIYENTNRLAAMGSDYFSLVNPYYNAPTIPDDTGLHSYSYSLDFYGLDPMGSTNYGKLTNVSIVPEASQKAQTKGGDGSTFDFVLTAVNNNIVRVSGGALGFPVL